MILIYLINFLFAIATTIGMTVMPLLITDGLGLSLFIFGLIEGSTEFISNILRLVTGNIFDRIKNKKMLFIVPSALALGSKLALFLPSAMAILASKIMERTANGAFAAPRDAYVGENAKNKGIALGILSSFKTAGCVLGPLLVSAVVLLVGSVKDNLMLIIFLACLVNFLGFGLSLLIDTKKGVNLTKNREKEFNFKDMLASFKNLKLIFTLSFLFFLGRFNDGVIMMHLKSEGFPEWFYLATISFFNTVMLLISPIIGYWVDKKKDYQVLIITILALLGFNIFSSQISGISWVLASLSLICWGIQRAGAQITFSALIFKNTPVKYYGSAIGLYSLLSGLGVFIASTISGHLAQSSFNNVFYFSGGISLCTLILAGSLLKRKKE